MEAYIDNREKGLFTFYLEQAELEDQLKKAKKQRDRDIEKKKQDKIQKKVNYTHNISQGGDKINELSKSTMANKVHQVESQTPKQDERRQNRKKLIEILQRQRYNSSKMQNLKIIMQGQEPTNAELKDQLSYLLAQVEAVNNNEQKYLKYKQKKQQKQRIHNPFQRLALCPTNFDTSFQVANKPKKVSHNLKTRSVQSTLLEYKKIERKQNAKEVSKKIQNQDKNINQIMQKNFLPKLQIKQNVNTSCEYPSLPRSQRSRLKAQRSNRSFAQKQKINHKSSKKKVINYSELSIENALHSGSYKNVRTKRLQNKIYPIFIQNPSANRYQQQKIDKQKVYSQIIKQLKFK